jgi:beta-glucosidase/6-phospho-beta-glucosidase/beta-galactosidase/ABC-type amino acid transport substrate-binding protein
MDLYTHPSLIIVQFSLENTIMSWRDRFTFLGGLGSIKRLPEDFIFGVASADHQCEAYKKGWEDIRDIWEPSVGKVERRNATEFWDRYAGDIQLAKDLGCKAFRFSVSWARVEIDPKTALDHYEKLVDEIIRLEMEPVLTLHHFVWPPHVDMLEDDFPKQFRDYVSRVAERMKKKVKYWVTFNEPNNLVWGYIKPFWESEYGAPPGRIAQSTLGQDEQIEAVGRLIPNLFRAHSRAYDEIKRVNPDAMVGANPWVAGFPPLIQWILDKNAERLGRRMKSMSDWKDHKTLFIDHKPFDHGRADVVLAAFTRTPKRESKVNFSSEVYFETEQMLLVRAKSNFSMVNDLAGGVIAVIEGSTAEKSVYRLLHRSCVPVVVGDIKAAMNLLDNKRAAAFQSDHAILQSIIFDHPGEYRLIDQPLESELYAAAVTQGNSKLLEYVDQAIWRFKASGEWEASYAKHIDSSAPPRPPASPYRTKEFKAMALAEGLSSMEKEDPSLRNLFKKGFLTIAIKSDIGSLGRKDAGTGEFSGFEVDLARAISRRIFGNPNNVVFHGVSAKDRERELITWRGYLDSIVKIYCIISTVFAYSNWWYLGLAGKLPSFICPEECWDKEGRPKMDYIGLDYYYGISTLRPDLMIGLSNAGSKGDFNEAPIWPGALYDHLFNLSNLINDPLVLKGRSPLPLFILENGWVDVRDKPMDRAAYIQEHIRQVQRAHTAGLNIKMYIYWSLTTNNEWGFPIGPFTDFGLYRIDLKKRPFDSDYQKRSLTDDCTLYKDIIHRRGV